MTFPTNDWHNRDKETSPLDFPNLPYLFDEESGFKLSQSNAILRYLGRKFKLDGSSEAERIRIDLTEQQVQDCWSSLIREIYSPTASTESLQAHRDNVVPDQLAALSRFLGSKDFFSGGSLSYADFKAYEWLYITRLFAPDAFAKHANLAAFLTRIESLPKVAAFIASDKYIAWPVSAPFAKWGNSVSNPELDPLNRKD